jgi:flavorubredoxin
VRAGLDKIAGLPIEYACTSHGPVLTKGVFLEEVIKAYGEWSAPVTHEHRRIPLFYCTAYGHTARLATAIKAGIKRAIPDAEVDAYNIIEHDMERLAALLNDSDAFLIGTITINRDAVPPVLQLLTLTDSVNIGKRPAAVFGTYGWSGEGFPHVTERLVSIKCKVFEKQLKINLVPSEDDLKAAEAFGEEFAGTL